MTIHAYTEPGFSNPACINLSERVSHPGDAIVTVRSAGENVASSIILSPDQLRALANDIGKHLDAGAKQDMAFGDALVALKTGKRVARTGWNGKGMFAYLVPANSYPAQTGAAKAFFGEASMVPYNAYLALKGADNTVSTWAPSGSDALAEDWLIVE
jgi:hypothetical protein